ncbi:hypothetical protein ZWY2020_041201 [Hordeum vulgare]|nr:hypothetical protein ZWY2020_041201 [Hordeum vulgare]
MARGACVCRAAACVLESDVTGEEEAGLGVSGVEDERPGAAGFDYHQRHGLRRRSARPPAVEKDPVRARSVPSASVSEPVDKFEREGSRLHFLEERDEELLSRRLMKLSQTNKVRSAIELFDSMLASGLQPNSHACNSLLASFVRRGSSVDAMKMYEFMKGKGLATGHTYTLILKAVARTEGYISALQMFSEIESERLEASGETVGKASCELFKWNLDDLRFADIMKAIIASCTKEGRWEFALATFRRMLSAGMKPNIIVFNSVINSLGKAGEDELAFRMYHLLTSSGLEPDQYTWAHCCQHFLNTHLYNIALMSCERLGQWEHALQLLWMMEKSELQISAVSYNHVIRACEVACEPKVALKVYHRMTHERCSPDTFTHLSVIRACIWGSLWDEVEDILEEVAPDSSIYNTVIHGLCLRGKIRFARKVYTKMGSIGLTPDGKTRSFMLQHIASAE